MSNGRYKLDGHTPVPVADLMEWALWLESADRRVAADDIGPYYVSTIFMGLDHRIGKGEPLLFETMIFGPDGDDKDGWGGCCSTWEQAEAMHETACALVRGALN